MSTGQRASSPRRWVRRDAIKAIEAADLPSADAHELTNALYGAPGLRANGLIWYWQLGAPSQIQEWVTLAADDTRIEIALDGDVTGLGAPQLDWRTYTGETRLLAWTACHEPLIELLRAVFRRDWVPEGIGDCDAPAHSACIQAGFTVLRADGLAVVSGVASVDASWIRTLATRGLGAEPRLHPFLNLVRTRLPLVIDELDVPPAELASIAPGAVVRVDNRTLSRPVSRIVVPAGEVRLVVDVSGVQATVVGLVSTPIGGDAMSDVQPPADDAIAGSQKPAVRPNAGVQVGTLPVRLMFSAGRLTLPFASLSDIGPGYVFALEKRLDDHAITMYANDVPIAVGELVTIGDLVGVRVTRMLARV
jgi:flagellar motor switch/type III secretory pathway protein FliN